MLSYFVQEPADASAMYPTQFPAKAPAKAPA